MEPLCVPEGSIGGISKKNKNLLAIYLKLGYYVKSKERTDRAVVFQ